jgi:cytoskeletal protein CcmA (bactofilin family)
MNDIKTIIGPGATVRGSIEGDEDLIVQGRVEGSVSISRTLTVDAGGTVQAEVSVHRALIRGVLVGNIEADDTVHIAAEGRVVGDIRAPRVVLEEGAGFNGNINMGEFDLEAKVPVVKTKPPAPLASRPVYIPEPAPEPESESGRPMSRSRAPYTTRPPMPIPSRPAVTSAAPIVPEKRSAPEPRVRPVGRVTVRRPSH